MDRLSKYSQRCLHFTSKNTCISSINLQEKLIKSVYNTIDKAYRTDICKLNIKKEPTVNALSKAGSIPIIWDLYKSLPNKDTDQTDFKRFFSWYSENQHLQNSVLRSNYATDFFTNRMAKLKDKDTIDDRLSLYYNRFVPLDVLMYLEYNDMTKTVFSCDRLQITLYNSTRKSDEVDIEKLVHICNFMRALSKTNNNKINLTVYCTDRKKKIRKKNCTLTSHNINSGSAIRGVQITLWRTEELYKVLIHELVHFFGLDVVDQSLLIRHSNKYKIDGKILLNEAYTETLAVVIHTVYLVWLANRNTTNSNITEDFTKLILHEINFSVLQVAHIMDHFSIKDLVKSYTNKSIKQTTSVFSYYIVKASLLVNLDKFLTLLGDTVEFNPNSTTKLLQLIDDSLHEDRFLNAVKCANTKDVSKLDTMRMTCLEVE